MRTTLLGVVLLALLALFALAVVDPTTREGSLFEAWLPSSALPAQTVVAAAAAPAQPLAAPTAAPTPPASPAAPVAPEAPAPESPRLITAGEISVLEPDAPEPMVRYVDSEGSVRMVRGLARVPESFRADAVALRSGHVNLVNVPAPSPVAFRDWQPEPNPNRHEVVLFSASWCGACERARRYLDQRGVRYDERDIDHDDSAREELVQIVGQVAIPLLEVNGRYISGFRPEVYDRALR